MNSYEQTQDRIVYAQAANLAVEMLKDKHLPQNEWEARFRELREWFYEELNKIPPNTIKYRRELSLGSKGSPVNQKSFNIEKQEKVAEDFLAESPEG